MREGERGGERGGGELKGKGPDRVRIREINEEENKIAQGDISIFSQFKRL